MGFVWDCGILTSCRAAVPPWRLCRVWLRPGLTGMLVRCMLSGTRFVVSAPKHKRKHSPTRLPDRLGYRLHRECNAVPERTFVSGNHSRCPPPAAWRLSHRVAECAEVWTHSDRRYLSWCFKAGAARHQANQYIGVTLSLILTFGRGNYCIGVPPCFI